MSTTSDWTRLSIAPGRFVAAHVVRQSGQARARTVRNAVVLNRVIRHGAVTVAVVVSAPAPRDSFTVTVEKGFFGATRASIVNTNAAPYRVVAVDNTRHDPDDASERVSQSVLRDRLMSTVPLRLPKADPRRLTMAAYYPWFARYSNPHFADEPAEPRSVWSRRGVMSMTRQAKEAGIDGFVVSWHGNAADGSAMDLVQGAAEATGQLFTAYLEVPAAVDAGSPRSAWLRVRQWLTQALARRSSPSFLTAPDGVPVIFVYGMAALPPAKWDDILLGLAGRQGVRVHLVGDALEPTYRRFEWGLHRYSTLDSIRRLTRWSESTALVARAAAAVDPEASPMLYAGTVSPGFDDRRLRGNLHPVIPRGRHGGRYARTWAAALAGEPDWVFVSTWNEWYEGTAVEPGRHSGRRALRQTARELAVWRR